MFKLCHVAESPGQLVKKPKAWAPRMGWAKECASLLRSLLILLEAQG